MVLSFYLSPLFLFCYVFVPIIFFEVQISVSLDLIWSGSLHCPLVFNYFFFSIVKILVSFLCGPQFLLSPHHLLVPQCSVYYVHYIAFRLFPDKKVPYSLLRTHFHCPFSPRPLCSFHSSPRPWLFPILFSYLVSYVFIIHLTFLHFPLLFLSYSFQCLLVCILVSIFHKSLSSQVPCSLVLTSSQCLLFIMIRSWVSCPLRRPLEPSSVPQLSTVPTAC